VAGLVRELRGGRRPIEGHGRPRDVRLAIEATIALVTSSSSDSACCQQCSQINGHPVVAVDDSGPSRGVSLSPTAVVDALGRPLFDFVNSRSMFESPVSPSTSRRLIEPLMRRLARDTVAARVRRQA
jgi:hypothetical protein